MNRKHKTYKQDSPRTVRPLAAVRSHPRPMPDDAKARCRAAGMASAAARREVATKLEEFRTELVKRVGGAPDAVQMALIEAAIPVYLMVLKHSRLNRGLNSKLNPMAVSACSSSLRVILHDLDAQKTTDADTRPGKHATQAERYAWNVAYLKRLEDESKPLQEPKDDHAN